jgi:hypothetical protein
VEVDSLSSVANYVDRFDVLVCNPPFGLKIVDKRPSVLGQYDLGHVWTEAEPGPFTLTSRRRARLGELGLWESERDGPRWSVAWTLSMNPTPVLGEVVTERDVRQEP